MKFMLIAKADKDFEAAVPPHPRLIAAIQDLVAEMTKAGVLIGSGGLAPSSKGVRTRLSGGKVTITDGPFVETKEVIAGYAIIDVKSKEEAIEWAKRFWQVHAEVLGPSCEREGEVRQMIDAEHCGAAASSGSG
jgi:hypothetical protein